MLGHYERPAWALPPHFLLIGADLDDPAFDYFLDLRRPTGEDFEVVSYPRAPDYPKGETRAAKFYRLYATLQDMLFASAFAIDRVEAMKLNAHFTLAVDEPGTEERFADVLRQLGATSVPELTGHARAYDAGDFAVHSYRSLDDGRWRATLGCDDKRRMGHLCELFADHGLRQIRLP
ncbi:MAG: hypothetical protein KC431_14705 [Myxococcales bacterium]|nr:hypothetical protein [Myxococcales bacterium]